MTASWSDQDTLKRRDLLGEYDPGTDPVPEDDDGEEEADD